MIVFTFWQEAITGMITVLSTPISYLGGLTILEIGVALTCVSMVTRFLIKPLFSKHHKQDSATEKKRKGNNG